LGVSFDELVMPYGSILLQDAVEGMGISPRKLSCAAPLLRRCGEDLLLQEPSALTNKAPNQQVKSRRSHANPSRKKRR
jgi:hypothetical protein